MKVSVLSLMFACLLGVLALPATTHADVTYTISPLIIDEEVEARDIITKKISITNTGTQPITIYPSVNNISLDEGGGIEQFLPASMSDRTRSLSSWIEVSRAGVDIKIGETKTIDLTLRISPTPVAGEYHALIGLGWGGNRDEAEAQVARGDAPGTIVTVRIVDKKTSLLKLGRFYVSHFVTGLREELATYTFKNPGDTTLTPKGEIIVYDNLGMEVKAFPVNPEHMSIAPGEEKTFSIPVEHKGLFGKYKALLSVEYGDSQLGSVNDTTFFYVFPVRIILPILGAVLVAVILIAFLVHRRYYGSGDDDGSELLHVHIRDTHEREAMHHDIDLRKP